MSKTLKVETYYDPVVKRWKSSCPVCGYFAARSKREAAEHVAIQHLAYAHGVTR